MWNICLLVFTKCDITTLYQTLESRCALLMWHYHALADSRIKVCTIIETGNDYVFGCHSRHPNVRMNILWMAGVAINRCDHRLFIHLTGMKTFHSTIYGLQIYSQSACTDQAVCQLQHRCRTDMPPVQYRQHLCHLVAYRPSYLNSTALIRRGNWQLHPLSQLDGP